MPAWELGRTERYKTRKKRDSPERYPQTNTYAGLWPKFIPLKNVPVAEWYYLYIHGRITFLARECIHTFKSLQNKQKTTTGSICRKIKLQNLT